MWAVLSHEMANRLAGPADQSRHREIHHELEIFMSCLPTGKEAGMTHMQLGLKAACFCGLSFPHHHTRSWFVSFRFTQATACSGRGAGQSTRDGEHPCVRRRPSLRAAICDVADRCRLPRTRPPLYAPKHHVPLTPTLIRRTRERTPSGRYIKDVYIYPVTTQLIFKPHCRVRCVSKNKLKIELPFPLAIHYDFVSLGA